MRGRCLGESVRHVARLEVDSGVRWSTSRRPVPGRPQFGFALRGNVGSVTKGNHREQFLGACRMIGKTIRIYLVDGSPTGILTAEIMNWTGKVTVGPRSGLAEFPQATGGQANRHLPTGSPGPDPENPTRDRVYVGEGDNALVRLTKHEADEAKDFWTRTVVITSKDENLTKANAHVRYLESRLVQVLSQSNRAVLVNGTAPPAPPLPEPDVADMEFFLAQVLLVLPVLGFAFTQPRPTPAHVRFIRRR